MLDQIELRLLPILIKCLALAPDKFLEKMFSNFSFYSMVVADILVVSWMTLPRRSSPHTRPQPIASMR